ncbi:hypothetical protein ABPG75_005897 [Micractinium tetrahymenae]
MALAEADPASGGGGADARTLLTLLERAAELLSSPPVSHQACRRMDHTMEQLNEMADCVDLHRDAEAVRSKVLALAACLCELNRKLLRQPTRVPFLSTHIAYCCEAINACVLLAQRLRAAFSRGDIYKLASALVLVFGAGAGALRALLLMLHSTRQPEQPRLGPACLAEAQRQLATVTHALPQLLGEAPQLAAAWARTAGKPAALLDWFAAVLGALTYSAAHGHDLGSGTRTDLCILSYSIVHEAHFRAHAADLAGDERFREALLCLLLRWVLPPLADDLATIPAQPGRAAASQWQRQQQQC